MLARDDVEEKGMRAEEEVGLPPSYYLDEADDPDILALRRQEDGTLVAAFSAWGATKEGIAEAAEEDHRALSARTASST